MPPILPPVTINIIFKYALLNTNLPPVLSYINPPALPTSLTVLLFIDTGLSIVAPMISIRLPSN